MKTRMKIPTKERATVGAGADSLAEIGKRLAHLEDLEQENADRIAGLRAVVGLVDGDDRPRNRATPEEQLQPLLEAVDELAGDRLAHAKRLTEGGDKPPISEEEFDEIDPA